MQKISPFLWFDTQAEEAAKFYVSLFPDSRILHTSYYSEGMPGPKGQVMVVQFELAGQTYMALNGGPQFKFNESMSLMVHCSTQKEIDTLWEKLTADGGEPSRCGWLKDKYGLSWQIVPYNIAELVSDPEHSPAVMQQVMKMTKLDIAALEAAAKG